MEVVEAEAKRRNRTRYKVPHRLSRMALPVRTHYTLEKSSNTAHGGVGRRGHVLADLAAVKHLL